jgi:hypothetical protein
VSVNQEMSLSSLKSAPESRPCLSCHQPARYDRPTAAIASISGLLNGAESGCLSCSVLIAGINSVIDDDTVPDTQPQGSVEWLRMDIGMGALGFGLNITLFNRGLEISVFAQPSSSKIAIPSIGRVELHRGLGAVYRISGS